MKVFIINLFSIFLVNQILAQVKNYQLQHSAGLGIIPYSINTSNDGNLLISNSEPNADVGFSHVIKVQPNGDTLFIKSSDAPYFYVTSQGNILSNRSVHDIALQNYTESYITMRDKNFNMKWQIDLTSNFFGSGFTISPPIVANFIELSPNKFMCTVNTYSAAPMALGGGAVIEFDSTGAINSTYTSPVYGNWLLDEKFNHKWISHSDARLMIAEPPVNNAVPIQISSSMPEISAVYYYNGKIYVASKNTQSGNKAMLSCIDTNLVVAWNKIIQPNNLTANNFIKDVIYSNNKLICQYQDDTLSYILNFDLSGNLLSARNLQLASQEHTTNLTLLNDSLYIVKNLANTPSGEALIKMDNAGNYSCSASAAFAVGNYAYSLASVHDSLRPTSFTYSLSNVGYNAYSYSIAIGNGCIVNSTRTLEEKEIFAVYPNPAKEILNIDLGTANENAIIKIYNAIGELVLTEDLETQNSSLNIHNLQSGIYFYRILVKGKIINSNKIVVIK